MSEIGPAHGPAHDPLLEHTGFRLSWGAIVAGMFVATALHIVLALLGLAIGLDVWEPGDRIDSLGVSLGIWTVFAGIIALFVGGLTTGRLAGVLTRGDGALHGVVLWSLSTILAAWLVASGVGTVLGGAFGVVGRTTAAVAGGAGQIGAAAVGEVGGLDLAALQSELDRALRETGEPAVHPDTIGAEAQRIGERATGPASTEAIAQDILQTVRERGSEIDRRDIANVIAARTDLSAAEAERVAARVENLVRSATQQAGELLDTAGVYVEQVAGEASEAVSTAAWWALLALTLSLAAAIGGVVIKARD